MATLTERIRQLQAQGYSNSEIINFFQEQGISPREINDAMARTQVKKAVAEDDDIPQPRGVPYSTQEMGEDMEGMQPSMVDQPEAPERAAPMPSEEAPAPGQAQYAPEQATTLETGQMPYYEQYPGQEYQYPAANADIISEITEQIISEKVKNIKSNMNSLIESSTLLATKVEKIDDRLKKIESIIDQLQMSLLRKANQQQQNVEDIKTEMQGMQQGFSKILNPLTDQIREFKGRSPRKTTHKKSKKK